jgi:hypothetical protein
VTRCPLPVVLVIDESGDGRVDASLKPALSAKVVNKARDVGSAGSKGNAKACVRLPRLSGHLTSIR